MKTNKLLGLILTLTMLISMLPFSVTAAVVQSIGDVEVAVGYRTYTASSQTTAINIDLDNQGETVETLHLAATYDGTAATYDSVNVAGFGLPADGYVTVNDATAGQLDIIVESGTGTLPNGTLFQLIFNSGATPSGLTITSAQANSVTCQYSQATFVTGIDIVEASASLVGDGQTQQLTLAFTPDDATYQASADVKWTADKPAVATVSASGLLTSVGPGTATITVESLDGHFTDTCSVTVIPEYTLTYNGNSPTGGTAPTGGTYETGTEITVAGPGDLAKTHYTFNGWNTQAGGGGTAYAAGATLTIIADTTLYAQWKPVQYTLSYDANTGTGTVPASVTADYQTEMTAAAQGSLTKANYSFSGWSTAAGGGGTAYATGAKFSLTGDIVLYAQWAINRHTVTYYGNTQTSGTAPASQTVDHGTVIQAAAAGTLAKTHYTFSGWNTAANGSGTAYAVGADIPVTADISLYAQWTINQYTLSYDSNGSSSGSGPASQTVDALTTVTVANAGTLAKTNYSFDGWNTAADGTGTAHAVGEQFSLTATTVLYAQWKIDQYTITYFGNTSTGGTVPNAQTVDYGSSATIAGAGTLVKTDYNFIGWNTAANGTGTAYAAGATVTVTSSLNLYAQWSKTQFTLTYNGNGFTGGTVPGTVVAETGTVQTLAAAGTMVKDHATFNGWNTAANGSGTAYAAGATLTLTSNVTLYAQWLPDQVTLTYDGNNQETGSVPAAVTYNYGTVVTLGAGTGLTRTHYTFDGWNTAADGTGTTYAASSSYTVTSTITLYVKWLPDQHTLTYDGNGSTGGTVPFGGTYDYQSEITVANQNTLAKTDFSFVNWNTAADGTGTAYSEGDKITITANVVLYAQWKHNPLTVTFNRNGGDTNADPTTTSVPYSTGAILPTTNPTRADYKFVGWNTSADGTGSDFTTATIVTANITVYAQWLQTAMYSFTVKNGGYNSIRLSWDASAGADGYCIYRSTAKTSGFSRIAYGVTATTYTDSASLTTGKTYYYKVRAFGMADSTVADSTHTYGSYTTVIGKIPLPAKPAAFTVAPASYKSLLLTWNAVSGATGYKVYRATSKSGTYKLIKTIANGATTRYTNSSGLTTGQTYYYKLRAYTTVNGSDVLGTITAIVSCKVVPGATASYTAAATANAGEVLHTWSAVSGATGYQIWVSDAADGTFTKVKTVQGVTTYTETGLTAGTARYYRIRAYRTVSGSNYFGAYVAAASPV